MPGEGLPEAVALLYGAAIIIAFSYERFNRISYETGRRLERLVNLLTPDKLRARQKVTYAYFLYTLALLMLYLVMCAYGQVVLPWIGGEELAERLGATGVPDASATPAAPDEEERLLTGHTPIGAPAVEHWSKGLQPPASVSLNEDSDGLGINPEVSLGLALIIVGLAPSVPPLTRFDEWMRMAAHRVAGIPTWVIDAADALRSNINHLKVFSRTGNSGGNAEDDLLVYSSDHEKMKKYRTKAKRYLSANDQFWLNLELILVASRWFLEEGPYFQAYADKFRFKDLEDSLRERRDELWQKAENDLDRDGWERLASDAEALASDLCVLIALYNEHGVIPPFDAKRFRGSPQQKAARERLEDFMSILLDSQTEPMRRRRATNLALFWTLSVVMAWAVIWAAYPGAAEFNLQRGVFRSDFYERVSLYSLSAFHFYWTAVIVAVTLRWVRLNAKPDETGRKWVNMRYPGNWTRWLPQAALVVFLGWAVATVVTLAVVIWHAGLFGTAGWNLRIWDTLFRSFQYNAPFALRGAVLALLVLILLDARQKLWESAGRSDKAAAKLSGVQERLRKNAKEIGKTFNGNGGDSTDAKTPEDAEKLKEEGKDLLETQKNLEQELAQLREGRKAWRALSFRDSFVWAGIGAGVMLIAAIGTRYLAYLGGAIFAGGLRDQLRPFDGMDLGLMIWSGIYCSILGALVLFCVSEALTSRALEKRGEGHHLAGGPIPSHPAGASG